MPDRSNVAGSSTGRSDIKTFLSLVSTVLARGTTTAALAESHAMKVCGSWSNFRKERWKTAESANKAALDAACADYISAGAQTSATKQLADIKGQMTQGFFALIILAQEFASISPAQVAPAQNRTAANGLPRLASNFNHSTCRI